MSETPITERQQHWIDHIRASEDFSGSIADYARSEGLKPKELYAWKGILARRGLFGTEGAAESHAGFVRTIAPPRPLGTSLVLLNGMRLEWHGEPGPEQLQALVLSASRLRLSDPQGMSASTCTGNPWTWEGH